MKFHNGEEFDADDVVYTLNFVAKPENKVVTQQNVNWIEKAEKVDKYKVRVDHQEAVPRRHRVPGRPGGRSIPNEYYEKVGPKGMNDKPVGSGPYKVVELRSGQVDHAGEESRTTSRTRPKPQPKIAKIEIRFIPDRQTQMAELISGGVDLIMSVPKDQAEQLQHGARPCRSSPARPCASCSCR